MVLSTHTLRTTTCTISSILSFVACLYSHFDFSLFSGAGNVWFSLNGTTYQNNSLVALEDIGEDDNALLCLTDNIACCGRDQSPGRGILGNWFYPNHSKVVNNGDMWDFYRNRDQSVVRLNRRRGGEEGIYHCVIPDTAGVYQTIYIEVYGKPFLAYY